MAMFSRNSLLAFGTVALVLAFVGVAAVVGGPATGGGGPLDDWDGSPGVFVPGTYEYTKVVQLADDVEQRESVRVVWNSLDDWVKVHQVGDEPDTWEIRLGDRRFTASPDASANGWTEVVPNGTTHLPEMYLFDPSFLLESVAEGREDEAGARAVDTDWTSQRTDDDELRVPRQLSVEVDGSSITFEVTSHEEQRASAETHLELLEEEGVVFREIGRSD